MTQSLFQFLPRSDLKKAEKPKPGWALAELRRVEREIERPISSLVPKEAK